jgi:hypothetical protein
MSESQKLSISLSQKGFQENYVPFVDPTEALGARVWRHATAIIADLAPA